MLTDKQNYAGRALKAPPPKSPASVLAQAAETSAAKIDAAKGGTNAAAQKKALMSYAQLLRDKYSTSTFDTLKKALINVQAQAVENSVQEVPADQKQAAADASHTALQQTTDATVPQIITAFQRPKDVSCSMSVLSWDEAHKALGRTVADLPRRSGHREKP
jgi:hypothetical protein